MCTADVRLSQLGGPWTSCEVCFAKNRAMLPSDASFIHIKGAVNQRYAYHSLSLRIRNRFICYAPHQCIGEVDPADNTVHYVTYAEVYDHARRLSTTLQLVIGNEGIVCLRSENKGWWIAADAAITFGGFVCGPIATSVAPSSMRKMMQMTQAKALLCSAEQFDATVKAVCSSDDGEPLDSLKLVVVLGGTAPPARPANWPNKVWLMGQREAMSMGSSVAPIRFSDDPATDLRTLIFTSGSTGVPKAVMIRDLQMVEEFDTVEMNPPSCSFVFEPLALAASRINTWRSLLNGGRIDMFSGNFSRFWSLFLSFSLSHFLFFFFFFSSLLLLLLLFFFFSSLLLSPLSPLSLLSSLSQHPTHLRDEVKATKPDWFSATPRIWNWCYSNFKSRVDALQKERSLEKEVCIQELECCSCTAFVVSASCYVCECCFEEECVRATTINKLRRREERDRLRMKERGASLLRQNLYPAYFIATLCSLLITA